MVLVAACSYTAPAQPSDDTPVDGAIDGAPDGTDATVDPDASSNPNCFGDYIQVCLTNLPNASATFDTINLDTGGGICVDTGTTAAGLCVVAATSITINNEVRAIGSGKPLVLIATEGAITVSTASALDASSRHGGNQGAGRTIGTCNAGTTPQGGGGGQGGSLSATGGNGGKDGAQNAGGGAGTAVTLGANELRGGCSGATGGNGGGAGGFGGGGLLLIAKTKIRVDGTVNASGSSGDGATTSNRGGGGGGSGGVIVFDAPVIELPGTVFANGGGGGEGSSGGAAGNPGGDPIPPTAGSGGNNGTLNGGDGGLGSLGNTGTSGIDGSSGAGGGGGGGGAGFIRVTTNPTLTGIASPTIVL